jgi:uncharacterized protein (TIGR03083 family)
VTTNEAAPPIDEFLSALHHSHDRLAAAIAPLTIEQLTAPSYAREWSIAQVLSHLGSGAEIFALFLDAGRRCDPAPGMQEFQPVWERWNAKSAHEQAVDAIRADAAFLDRLGTLTGAERDQWRLSLFGVEQSLSDLLRLRLGEHAPHTWDVTVVLDPRATIAADAVALLIDSVGQLVVRIGKPADEALRVRVSTEAPHRRFLLEVGRDGARLSPIEHDEAAADAALRLPAEALLRLVYGRLDPEHTPPVETERVDLDALRRVFPGF